MSAKRWRVLRPARGNAVFREANVTHEAINMGDKPLRVIEVEIKRPG
jgi:mannose-6-phosphate isomerase-like protein (cupin superfamily)